MTRPEVAAPRLPWSAVDPYPFYESRRSQGDVVWDDTAAAWLVLGYHAAREVLSGTGWTSDPLARPSAVAAVNAAGTQFAGRSMLFTDGAIHQRLRGSMRDVFTRSFVSGLSTGVEAITAAAVDAPATAVPFDFMAEIALPIPIAVIGEWLGLDDVGLRVLQELSPPIVAMLGTLADDEIVGAGAAAAAELTAAFLALAADRRAHPGDDLISFIAGDPDLELDEVAVNAVLLAVAGHETTANLLGAGLLRLLDPLVGPAEVTAAMVTELLRLDAPAQAVARTATVDQRIGGVHIPAGDPVLVVVAAANRDPGVYAEPDQFRPDRDGPPPLSFGHGEHYCLGAALARLETTVALRAILAREPRLAGPVQWRDTPAIRGPLRMPVAFGK
ncbi:cytochrome [Mycolicibacter minnesotensis]|uniref:Cytochrome n=1 Tax=Mycolicibacter minnesotensis TaxID=1118379 RepID=A0A7I7R286_9MYCO|nr:cytochrome P450 [Mycolicibacter minnesotensis]ORB02575.1 cytochrome [Mycolicibacter minnesotensis]BBY32773.1 putative cytochrome P450 [Mycolicibacter minnesotensis]